MAGERLAATIGAIGSVAAVGAIAIFAYMSTTTAKRDHDYFAGQLDAVNAKLEQTNKAVATITKTTATPETTHQELAAIEARTDTKIKSLGDMLVAIQKASSSSGVMNELGLLNAKIEKANALLADVRKAPASPDIAAQITAQVSAQVAPIGDKLAATDKSLTDIGGKADAGNALAQANGAAIAKLEKSIGSLHDGIAAQATSLTTISSSLASVTTSLDTLKSGIEITGSTGDKTAKATAPVEPEKNLVVVYLPAQVSPKMAEPGQPAPLSVRFDRIGSTHPAASTDSLVGDLKKIMKEREGCIVSVAGYADTVGTDNVNLQVSRDRAQAVASQLRTAFAGQNVQINEVAWGERQLKVWTPDGKSEKANRRVDISVDCKN